MTDAGLPRRPEEPSFVDYVCALLVEKSNRPGVVARVAHLFAERGINLSEVLATRYNEQPLLLLRFESSARLRDFMMRRLARLPEVFEVRVLPSSDRPLWDYLDAAASPVAPNGVATISRPP